MSEPAASSRPAQSRRPVVFFADSPTVGDYANRSSLNGAMSNPATPSVRKEAWISPMALENLNPCPEHGLEIKTFGCDGCQSMMKS